jgi:hypothetical protein
MVAGRKPEAPVCRSELLSWSIGYRMSQAHIPTRSRCDGRGGDTLCASSKWRFRLQQNLLIEVVHVI